MSLCFTRFGCDRRCIVCTYHVEAVKAIFYVYTHYSMYVCVYTLYRPAARTEVVGIKRVERMLPGRRQPFVIGLCVYIRCGTNMFRYLENKSTQNSSFIHIMYILYILLWQCGEQKTCVCIVLYMNPRTWSLPILYS